MVIPLQDQDVLPGRRECAALLHLLFILIVFAVIIIPVSASDSFNSSAQPSATGPAIVHIGVYVVDFSDFSVQQGTYSTNFYLNIDSDANVSLDDFELMNGHTTSIDTIINTPEEKNYRIFAVMTANPDLRLFPFDKHTLPILIEPKIYTERDMVFVIDENNTGLDSEANIPGWTITGMNALVTNKTYEAGEIPYSRAVFDYSIERDVESTILKFFLPISLIVIVSLASLLMKVSSRLGLNGSMFLAAVLIHWRIADDIPLVAYATFLDFFMIITYATLVMVLVSGILILKFTEDKNLHRVEQVNYWSIRIIPAVSISLYILLFLSLLL